jgi:prepilin-type N-terminal cleavage/methylation domain-containing protein|tara:strand:+ start:55 stop:672 length:618 start_codon:yes stop_codon:yes gene_type:complete
MILSKTSKGMTLIEMAAVVVVTGIIALGMTMGTRGVLLHYQTDHVRQDLRQYGNSIMREIVRELNLAQRVEVDGLNGFSRLKLFKFYNDLTPSMVISCHQTNGVQFNYNNPIDGTLKLPNFGAYRSNGQRSVWVKDFVVNAEAGSRPGLTVFKQSYLHLELTVAMDQDVFINGQTTTEDHYFHRGVFMSHSYIMKKLTNDQSTIS